MQAQTLTCPHCGAPLPLQATQQIALCAYCNTSVRVVADPAAPGPVRLAADQVPHAIVEQVKQLVVAGRQDEAIALYAEHAAVTQAEASEAVKQLITPLLFRLTRRMPMQWGAMLIVFLLISGLLAGAGWAALRAVQGELGLALLALACLAAAVLLVRFIAPHLVSALVYNFGAEGRARFVKVAVLKVDYVKGGTLVLALVDVTPAAGGASFRDEEAWLVRSESMPKVAVGNIIRVRFDRGKDPRVFPISPIEVVGRG